MLPILLDVASTAIHNQQSDIVDPGTVLQVYVHCTPSAVCNANRVFCTGLQKMHSATTPAAQALRCKH